jgi:hypothetical protein
VNKTLGVERLSGVPEDDFDPEDIEPMNPIAVFSYRDRGLTGDRAPMSLIQKHSRLSLV